MKNKYYVIIKSGVREEIKTRGWSNTGGPYIFDADISLDKENWERVKIRALTSSSAIGNNLEVDFMYEMELDVEAGKFTLISIKC